ncbi:EndoS/ChiA family endoglycosidase, partial [Helcococcus ovis]
MKNILRKFSSFLLAVTFIMNILSFNSIVKADSSIKNLEKIKKPLLFGYYRAWHDKMNGKEVRGQEKGDRKGIQNFDGLPKEVDVAFLFVNWIDNDYGHRGSPFWKKLPEYVNNLHKNGTKVVRTIDIGLVLNTSYVPCDGEKKAGEKCELRKFENTPQGHKDLAKLLVKEYVERDNLDGLDVDYEKHSLPEEQLKMAVGVINEIGKLIGPNSKNKDKLFIFDTDKLGSQELFKRTAKNYDYVLYQSYRQENLDDIFKTFKEFIPASKFVPGFSFYEEGDWNKWFNLSSGKKYDWNRNKNAKLEETFAYRSADWQPKNKEDGTKGGVFAFAIERSGIVDGDDTIKPANYDVVKKLHSVLNESHNKRLKELGYTEEKNKWIQKGDDYYYLDSEGKIAKNKWQGSYYLKNDGKMAKSEWIFDNSYNSWHYLKKASSHAKNKWQGSYYLKN